MGLQVFHCLITSSMLLYQLLAGTRTEFVFKDTASLKHEN